MSRLCKEQGIPFPPISPGPEEQRQPRECHVFCDPAQPKAPAVLHFPLVNDTFQDYVAPGEPCCLPSSLASVQVTTGLLPKLPSPHRGATDIRGEGGRGGEPIIFRLPIPLHKSDLQQGGCGQAVAPDALQHLQQPGTAAGGHAPGRAAAETAPTAQA